MPLLSEAEFGSFLVYSPRGTEQPSKNSKAICIAIKDDSFLKLRGTFQRAIPFFVRELKLRLPGSDIEDFFLTNPLLVPAPRSAPTKAGSLYPTRLICEQMVTQGLGSETKMLLERIEAVPKAATSAPKDRPTLTTHYNSMRVSGELVTHGSILIVDDVITRGTMLLASISRLKDTYPNVDVRAFALIRTMSGEEVSHPVKFCRGTISIGTEFGTRRRP
jgi:hypothetical protein